MKLLLLAVVAAQAFDAATFLAMPRLAEVNPLAQSLNAGQAWLVKVFVVTLVAAVVAITRVAARRSAPKYAWEAVLLRNLVEIVAIVAIAAGCVGAGSNLAVLSMMVRS